MEKQVLVKKTLKCVCAAALMVAILAAQHDSLIRVKAEDKLVQTSPSVSAIDDLHYLSENSKKEFKEGLSKAGEVPEKLKDILSMAHAWSPILARKGYNPWSNHGKQRLSQPP